MTDVESHTPTENFEPLTNFQMFFAGFKVAPSTGDVTLTFTVPSKWKGEALKVSDYPGRMMKVGIELKVFDGFGVSDG